MTSLQGKAKRPLVIFDYDGTLVDSIEDIAQATNNTRVALNLASLSTDFVRGLVGDGIQIFLKKALPELNGQDFDKAKELFVANYLEHSPQSTCLYPGVLELLDQLQGDGYVMAVVSNKPQAMLDKINKTLGLCQYFKVLLGGDALAQRKPDPAPLLAARQLSGLGDDTPMIMVGDGAQDLSAAHAAGATSIWVSWGMNRKIPGESDFVANTPAALCEHIMAITGNVANNL